MTTALLILAACLVTALVVYLLFKAKLDRLEVSLSEEVLNYLNAKDEADELRKAVVNKVDLQLYLNREKELLDNIHNLKVDNNVITDKLLQIKENYDKLYSTQVSKSVRLGQVAESIAPLLNQFPYDYKKAVPMFKPVDYVVFEDNEIIFVEYKTGGATLTDKQRNIKKLVQEGKIRFEVHRISEGGYEIEK